jgi:uncharacterized protein (TIGR02268 family)
MHLVSAAGLLALALFATPIDTSLLFNSRVCEEAGPRLALPENTASTPLVVCLSRGQPTTLRFYSELLQDAVNLEQRERFVDMSVGEHTLTIFPAEDMRSGESFRLKVCFADGQSPSCTTLLLVMHPALSHRKVEVFRSSRPPGSYKQEAAEARAEARQYREELLRCRAERGSPGGLTGLLLSGLLGKYGLAQKNLEGKVLEPPGNALRVSEIVSYRAKGRVAVEVQLNQEWETAGAVLRGPKGELLRPLPFWPTESRPSGTEPRDSLIVEVLLPGGEQALGVYTLALWDTEGREVVIGNATFPSLSG